MGPTSQTGQSALQKELTMTTDHTEQGTNPWAYSNTKMGVEGGGLGRKALNGCNM